MWLYLSLYISVFIIWTLILFLFFLQHRDKKHYYIKAVESIQCVSFMNRPVGVCITQISRNTRISGPYKLYAFYYFYIVVLSVSSVQIIKRKYIMTNINTHETDYSVYNKCNIQTTILYHVERKKSIYDLILRK